MSCSALSRTSPLQIPVLPSSMSSPDKRSAFRGSLDCRVKPDNDSIIFSSVIPERFPVIFGLEPDISFRFPCLLPLSHPRASIARPGDLLDCRIKSGNDGIIFSSVILELFPVMFGLEPNISFTDSRVKHGNDRGEEKSPAMTKKNKHEHDRKE